MTGNHGLHVHLENLIEPLHPTAEVAIAEPRKAADEQEVPEKDDARVAQMDDEVAVAMRGTPIFAAQFIVRNVEHEFVGEAFGRRAGPSWCHSRGR